MAKQVIIDDIVKADKGTAKTKRDPLSEYAYDIENEEYDFLSTNCIPLNVLYAGRVNGGIPLGHMTMISADTMMGKSFIASQIMRNAQKKKMQIVVLDVERAFKKKSAESLGIDVSAKKMKVFRENEIGPLETIIQNIASKVPKDQRKNVLFVFDSWGSLVSSKALKDAETGNMVKDMSMSQQQNRLANIILNTGFTFFIINHVYSNVGGFGDPLSIPGGKKSILNCEAVALCMSRAKDKNAEKVITGHIIKAKTYKSRWGKGESQLSYRIRDNGGIDPYYGMLKDAVESGFVVKPKDGKYTRPVVDKDKLWTEKNLYCGEFWGPIYKDTDFALWLKEKYTFKDEAIIIEDDELLSEIFA